MLIWNKVCSLDGFSSVQLTTGSLFHELGGPLADVIWPPRSLLKINTYYSIDFEIRLYFVHTFRKPLKPFVEVRWASLCRLNLPYPPQEFLLCGSLVPLTSSRSINPLIENLLSSWQNAVENWSLKITDLGELRIRAQGVRNLFAKPTAAIAHGSLSTAQKELPH